MGQDAVQKIGNLKMEAAGASETFLLSIKLHDVTPHNIIHLNVLFNDVNC
jgi:hypothetical protein